MAYKDKEQQKEANRIAAQKRRDKVKGMTADVTEGMTNVTPNEAHVTPDTVIPDRTASLMDYHANPTDYIPRLEPDKLNWGQWMTVSELERDGLKANRVTMPGDWDYEQAA